ncbi:HupE/UreJ family protein [Fulvivirgaceae bacterium BMA12]|uniref:HupE/UreJ family protein n=1 Tax=Agaribacillus aureus TaxID=3051825 RepID=A0ABT8L9W4_9BACT|nr:HupE/UreJ family protein [Fulvivirgaceae bacterium BMA12]
MATFWLYFQLGVEHILDIDGYDHILFVVALCAVYAAKDWKNVLILVTAFTVGHSVTLALSTLNIIQINGKIIEFLIPVTIFITAISNITKPDSAVHKRKISINYAYALFFGLIHGLGFSNYLKGLLGKDVSIVSQLLAFNVGLELGQIAIVIIYILISFIFIKIFNVAKNKWSLITSSMIMGIAITMMIETKFW